MKYYLHLFTLHFFHRPWQIGLEKDKFLRKIGDLQALHEFPRGYTSKNEALGAGLTQVVRFIINFN